MSLTLAVALAFFFYVDGVHAQLLVGPDEVVIYIHKDLTETDFVDGLVCELSRVLVAPVRTDSINLPLDRSYLATPTQLDAEKLSFPFHKATVGDNGAFRYLLLPYDLKVSGLNYVFADTTMSGAMVAVMSTIRLIPRDPQMTRKRVSDITGDRLYKLMLKSIALLSGLRSKGCIMKFPRSLPELDAKPAEFCPEDRAALVAAHVLKDKPFGACNTVAMVTR
jgi:predicted Zn-dependent protease